MTLQRKLALAAIAVFIPGGALLAWLLYRQHKVKNARA